MERGGAGLSTSESPPGDVTVSVYDAGAGNSHCNVTSTPRLSEMAARMGKHDGAVERVGAWLADGDVATLIVAAYDNGRGVIEKVAEGCCDCEMEERLLAVDTTLSVCEMREERESGGDALAVSVNVCETDAEARCDKEFDKDGGKEPQNEWETERDGVREEVEADDTLFVRAAV